VDLSDSSTVIGLQDQYDAATGEVDVPTIAAQRTQEINDAIAAKDLPKLLEYYDNKGLIALAASHLRNQRRDNFEEWVVRSLLNDTCPPLKQSLREVLPEITAL
jgi:hypothetical protein